MEHIDVSGFGPEDMECLKLELKSFNSNPSKETSFAMLSVSANLYNILAKLVYALYIDECHKIDLKEDDVLANKEKLEIVSKLFKVQIQYGQV